MRFEVQQRYEADPRRVIELYTDPSFYDLLTELPRVGQPEVRDRSVAGDRITMRVHYAFTADLPSAAHAIIDADKLTWIEETVYDLSTLTCTSRMLPDHYADRLTASAKATFEARGDGTVRSVTGDLRVRVLLVAGKVENAIVSGLREHLADEARVANDHLQRSR